MMSDDELRSELNGLAERTEISTVSLDEVQARGRRRTLYQRGAVVLAAFALVVGGTYAVTSIGDDDDGLDVATEETDGVTTDSADDSGETDDATADDGEARVDAPTTTVQADDMTEAIDAASSIAFGGEFWGGPHRVVPWGDGFLAFGERFVPAEEPAIVFDGSSPIGEYFPQEILDVVEGSGATTIQEASDALADAGLLDQATQIVMDNPEVMAWYEANASGGTYEPFVETSDDGVNWETVDGFTWPGEQLGWFPLASNGSHLVVVDYQPDWDPETNRQIPTAITVHVTTDLTTWSSVDVPYVAPAAPAYVNLDISPEQIVVTDDAWFLTVASWQWIDLWSALPQDVLDEMNENGYDWIPTEDGVEIVEWNWDEYEEYGVPATTVVPDAEVAVDDSGSDAVAESVAIEPPLYEEPEPTVIRVIPWSELPFTYDDYMGAQYEQSNDRQAFLGDLATGTVTPVDVPGGGNDGGQIIVTDAGLFTLVYDYPEPVFEGDEAFAADFDYTPIVTAHFSADGRTWRSVDLPALDEGDWIDTAVAVENGILLTVSSGRGGQSFFVAAADGSGFAEVDGPDLPENAHVWFPSHYSMGDGAASVIDIGHSNQPQFAAYEVTFSHDGFEITTSQTEDGTGTIRVVDGDGEVVYEHSGSVYEEPPFEYGENGVVIPDGDGGTLVEIPFEVMETEVWRVESEAWEAIYEANPYVPDFRLVATRDGRSWTVVELPAPDEEYGWYGDAIVSGGRVLLSDGTGNWQAIPLS